VGGWVAFLVVVIASSGRLLCNDIVSGLGFQGLPSHFFSFSIYFEIDKDYPVWTGPDQARPVQDCQSGARSSPTFWLDRTGLSPTPDRVRPDWWNHCDGGKGNAQDHGEENEDVPSDEDEKADDEPPHPESETRTDDVLSMITDSDNTVMMAQNWMLLKQLFEQQAIWKEECSWMVAEFNCSRATEWNETTKPTQLNIFRIVDAVGYCGGVTVR